MNMQGSDPIFSHFARIAAALASESRARLLDRLCQGEQTVDQLADAAGLSVSNTSRHLRQLAQAGLASVRREPPYVFYRIGDDTVLRLWFALRDVARAQSLELDRAIAELIDANDGVTPMRRDELLERMTTGEVIIVDVRPDPEYRAGHIPGAISIPIESLQHRIDSLPPGRDIVAYCRGPYCVLSVEAVTALRSHGRSAVRLADGLPEWKAAGLPVETA